jgi:hypothetical protein
VNVPLEAETSGILLLIHEANHAIDLRIFPAAAGTDQLYGSILTPIFASNFEAAFTSDTPQDRGDCFSESGVRVV